MTLNDVITNHPVQCGLSAIAELLVHSAYDNAVIWLRDIAMEALAKQLVIICCKCALRFEYGRDRPSNRKVIVSNPF